MEKPYLLDDKQKNERVANRSSTDLSRPVGNAMKNNSSSTIIPDSGEKVNSEGKNHMHAITNETVHGIKENVPKLYEELKGLLW